MGKTKIKVIVAFIAVIAVSLLAVCFGRLFSYSEAKAADDYTPTNPDAVAVVDGTEYTSLSEAVYKAPSDSTVEILKDVSLVNGEDKLFHSSFNGGVWLYIQGKSLTIDGNGHTLTSSGAQWAIYAVNADASGPRTESMSLSISDLTIKAQGETRYPIGIFNENIDLDLTDVTLDCSDTNINNSAALL